MGVEALDNLLPPSLYTIITFDAVIRILQHQRDKPKGIGVFHIKTRWNVTMGFKSYFKNPRATHLQEASANSAVSQAASVTTAASDASADNHDSSSISSSGTSGNSSFMEDLKYEVMVNYLYQQQCAHLWVGDEGGNIEGVLLRKSRNEYLSCPPQLVNSPLGDGCAALNVLVCFFSLG